MVQIGLIVLLVNVVLLVISIVSGAYIPALVLLAGLLYLAFWILEDSLNLIHRLGSIYWILRDTGKKGDKVISSGWLRQAAPPWMVGHGLQIRAGKYVFQIGTFVTSEFNDEEDGVLSAMQGRKLDMAPKDIRSWH